MKKADKKQLIQVLRETATEQKPVLKTNKSLTAKLAYLLRKEDSELMKVDDTILSEHLANIHTYVNSQAPVKAAQPVLKAKPQKQKNEAQPDTNADTDTKENTVDIFPDTFVYELRNDDDKPVKKLMTRLDPASVTNIDQFRKLIESSENDIFICVYWPVAFKDEYYKCLDVPAPKTAFTSELDVSGVALITDTNSHVYAMSVETQGMYIIRKDEIAVDKKKKNRVIRGEVEFDFYEACEYVEPKATTKKPSSKKPTLKKK